MRPTPLLLTLLTACSTGEIELDLHRITVGSEEAVDLATFVRNRAGGSAAWQQVRNLVFTFAGQRRLFWDVEGEKIRIENLAPVPGGWHVLVHDLRTGRDLIAGPPDAEGRPVSAWPLWYHDTYWLLANLKVLDPGSRLLLDPRQPDDPPAVRRLHLWFEKVGPNPENEYVLHIDTVTGDILRWDFFERAGAAPRSHRFERYEQVGPLRLSLSRVPIGDAPRVELTDVAVNVRMPADIWQAAEPRLR